MSEAFKMYDVGREPSNRSIEQIINDLQTKSFFEKQALVKDLCEQYRIMGSRNYQEYTRELAFERICEIRKEYGFIGE